MSRVFAEIARYPRNGREPACPFPSMTLSGGGDNWENTCGGTNRNPLMEPSASIIAVAAVQFLGSSTILLLWGQFLWGWVKYIRQYPVNHDVFPLAVWVAFVAVPIGFGLLGLVASIGLLRLREWARQFTMLLSTAPVLAGAALAALRPPTLFPPNPPGDAMLIVKPGIVLAVFLCILVLLTPISIWWLVVMTRRSVRSQFR